MFEKKGRDLLQVRYFLCEKRQRDRSDRKEGYDVSVAGSTAGSTDHPEWGILIPKERRASLYGIPQVVYRLF